MEIVLVEWKDMLIFQFVTSFLPRDAVMCAVYCTPKKAWGITSLTITAREINNQVSLLPPFPHFRFN